MNVMETVPSESLFCWIGPEGGIFPSREELQGELRRHCRGVIVLDGASGCGKTKLLRQLRGQCCGEVAVVSYQTVTEEMARLYKNGGEPMMERITALLGAYPILAVEDVDYLYDRTHTQRTMGQALRKVSEQSLVVLTGRDLVRLVPILLEEIGDVRYYRAVRK